MNLVFLDYLRCDGDEEKLVDCSSLYFLPQCSHEDNVGVRCNGTSSMSVEAANASIEVGYVCKDT